MITHIKPDILEYEIKWALESITVNTASGGDWIPADLFQILKDEAFDSVDHNKLWKILKEMGIPDHLICLLRNLYAAQDATVRTRHGTAGWFNIGKGVCQCCILSPCLFILHAASSCEMPGWIKHKLKSRLPGETSMTSDTQMTPPLWQKVKRN